LNSFVANLIKSYIFISFNFCIKGKDVVKSFYIIDFLRVSKILTHSESTKKNRL